VRVWIDRFHEKAGLFAYGESLAARMKWDDHPMDREVSVAVQNVPATCKANSGIVNQVSVYDLEAKQWHFVALADLKSERASKK
jgi:hypothetical protein